MNFARLAERQIQTGPRHLAVDGQGKPGAKRAVRQQPIADTGKKQIKRIDRLARRRSSHLDAFLSSRHAAERSGNPHDGHGITSSLMGSLDPTTNANDARGTHHLLR